MSIESVQYIPCIHCSYAYIGKVEKWQQLACIGPITVFEVTTSWICLRCQCVQRSRVDIREIL